MTLDTWLTFTLLELVLCLTPGPAVLFVTSTTALRGARAGVSATAGILASNLMYFVISATGVAALLLASPTLFEVLRWSGSVYLLLLGIRLLLARPSVPVQHRDSAASSNNSNLPLLHGFMVQTLNPKAIAFFAALLPQFVNPAVAVAPQVLILTVTSVAVEASVMACYIWLTLHFGRHTSAGSLRWLKCAGGALLIVSALRLALPV
jgi:homoserine/homoserine lactone efflux protein